MNKKLVALMLALAMCLSLCACGGGNDKPKNEEQDKNNTEASTHIEETAPEEETEPTHSTIVDGSLIALNEPVKTDYFQITLTSVEFADALYDTYDEQYLKPTTGATTITAADGKVLLSFAIDLKYIGKKEINCKLGGGYFAYGKEYTFDSYQLYMMENGSWAPKLYTQDGHFFTMYAFFEPLDETIYQLRGYYELPVAVVENENEPASLVLNFLGERFTYIIR